MKLAFPKSAEPARRVARRLRDAGGDAVLIGGCVRDLCLEKEPADYDVATSLPPDQVLTLFPNAIETGRSFGVIRVRTQGTEIEVATFRCDGPYSDGRRPDSVTFTTLENDIHRRDFTVNALAANPETGDVIDHVGGLEDLKRKIIRTVGDPRRRFSEDRLRLIRAVRFAHTLKFSIEEETFRALEEMAPSINDVAAERLFIELTKILTSPPAGDGVALLDKAGLLEPLLPEITALKNLPQPEEFHPEGDVFVHTLLTLNALKDAPSAAVAWAALLHDIGKPGTFEKRDRIRFHGHAELGARMSRRIARRFRMSRALEDRIHIIILEHQKFADVDRMRPGRLMNWAGREHFRDLLEVHRADCVASHGDLSAFETSCRVLREIERIKALPPRAVTGHTLIRLGLTPGPAFSEILRRCYEAQLEGLFSTEESAVIFLREEILPEIEKKTKRKMVEV
ncbi:MAG: CCA tRNA nucleotidyltransferase [Candidatus Hydrogenedentota bacterium]|nr:MAG: CCA tRNA nucleotidyltransferase [Candidatus Hydrogenedentota bacterium]